MLLLVPCSLFLGPGSSILCDQFGRVGGGVQMSKRRLLDVLVLGVDDIGQVLAVDLFLKDPHLDLVVKVIELANVASNDLGDSGTPFN